MTTSPFTVDVHAKLFVAYDLMREHRLGHLPVLEDGKLVGLVSRCDLYLGEVMESGPLPSRTLLQMTRRNVPVVAPGDCVADVARTMVAQRESCVVVVDRGSVVGIFTNTDALAVLAKLLPHGGPA